MLNFIRKKLHYRYFPVKFVNFFMQLFWRTSANNCLYKATFHEITSQNLFFMNKCCILVNLIQNSFKIHILYRGTTAHLSPSNFSFLILYEIETWTSDSTGQKVTVHNVTVKLRWHVFNLLVKKHFLGNAIQLLTLLTNFICKFQPHTKLGSKNDGGDRFSC